MSPVKVDKIEIPCSYCGTILYRYPCLMKAHKNHFCNISCKALWQGKNCKGENNPNYGPNPNLQGGNNPNYGNRWTKEQKIKQSREHKNRMQDPFMRWLAGTANRGKKFSLRRIQKMHSGRDKKSYSHPHTEKSRKLIGKKSAAKWTQEYRIKHRKKMEELGHWIPLSEKADWEIYFIEADWVDSMQDYCSKQEKELSCELGIFNSYNTKGVVRDHIFSRQSGFRQKVFPEILRHPANCQIITHKDNVSKAQSNNKDRDDQTLDELFRRIINYNQSWKEQYLCIDLIDMYIGGQRWQRR